MCTICQSLRMGGRQEEQGHAQGHLDRDLAEDDPILCYLGGSAVDGCGPAFISHLGSYICDAVAHREKTDLLPVKIQKH